MIDQIYYLILILNLTIIGYCPHLNFLSAHLPRQLKDYLLMHVQQQPFAFHHQIFHPDNDLVDFSMKCPVELKIRDTGDVYRIDENIAANKTEIYFEKTNNGKLILRSAMEGHLPEEVLSANKRGFSGPDASWFRGESIDYVKRKLLSGEHNLSDIVHQDTVVEMLEEHFSGKINNRLAIWSLLYAEELIGQVFN